MTEHRTPALDYSEAAELYPGKKHGRSVGYRRFDTAANAIKYAIEDLPSELLKGAVLEVGDERFDSGEIEALYRSDAFPLARRGAASPAKPEPPSPSP